MVLGVCRRGKEAATCPVIRQKLMSVKEKLVRFARKSPSDRWAAGKAMLRDIFSISGQARERRRNWRLDHQHPCAA